MNKDQKPNAFVSGSKFADKGTSVEEARKAMLQSGQAPKGILQEAKKNREVGADVQAAPAPVKRKPATKAKFTVINADGSEGEPQIVEAATPAELQSTINKAHAQAQSRNMKLKVEFITDETPAPEPVKEEPAPEPVAAAPVVEEPVVESADDAERIETNRFVAEIKKVDGQMVAEIVYKNGAGPERFEGKSRKELMRKLLEGKANATLRVREATRREKYGTDLDKVYTLPDYITQEEFDKLKPEQQRLTVDTLASQEALAWHQQHPENYITEDNSLKIQKFLNKRDLPYTAKNLQYAYEELSEAEELETRPVAPKIATPSVPPAAPKTVDSASAATPAPAASVAPAPVAPAPVVRKRGSTGLQPGQSSVVDNELETTAEEQPAKPAERGVAELRQLSDADLKAAYRETLARKRRQF